MPCSSSCLLLWALPWTRPALGPESYFSHSNPCSDLRTRRLTEKSWTTIQSSRLKFHDARHIIFEYGFTPLEAQYLLASSPLLQTYELIAYLISGYHHTFLEILPKALQMIVDAGSMHDDPYALVYEACPVLKVRSEIHEYLPTIHRQALGSYVHICIQGLKLIVLYGKCRRLQELHRTADTGTR